MKWTPQFRPAALLAALMGTVFAAGLGALTSAPLDRELPPVVFPADTQLPGWEAVAAETSALPAPNTARYRHALGSLVIDLETQFIPDLPVHYVRNPQLEERFLPRGKLPLEASLRYFVNSRGSVIANLRSDRPSTARVEAREGGYGFWETPDRLHLSAIVTPGGETAITTREVARRMYLDQLTPGRLWSWLRDRTALPDRRCVLVHLSLPVDTTSPEQAHEALAQAWSEWRGTHLPVFPK